MPAHTPSQPDSQLVDTVTTAILARHPAFTHDQLRAEVAASYHRLTADSRIPDHLAVLVQHEATDRLRDATTLPSDDHIAVGA